jgi:hypothetical protein
MIGRCAIQAGLKRGLACREGQGAACWGWLATAHRPAPPPRLLFRVRGTAKQPDERTGVAATVRGSASRRRLPRARPTPQCTVTARRQIGGPAGGGARKGGPRPSERCCCNHTRSGGGGRRPRASALAEMGRQRRGRWSTWQLPTTMLRRLIYHGLEDRSRLPRTAGRSSRAAGHCSTSRAEDNKNNSSRPTFANLRLSLGRAALLGVFAGAYPFPSAALFLVAAMRGQRHVPVIGWDRLDRAASCHSTSPRPVGAPGVSGLQRLG